MRLMVLSLVFLLAGSLAGPAMADDDDPCAPPPRPHVRPRRHNQQRRPWLTQNGQSRRSAGRLRRANRGPGGNGQLWQKDDVSQTRDVGVPPPTTVAPAAGTMTMNGHTYEVPQAQP